VLYLSLGVATTGTYQATFAGIVMAIFLNLILLDQEMVQLFGENIMTIDDITMTKRESFCNRK